MKIPMPNIGNYSESQTGITLHIPTRSSHYTNWLFKLKCAPDLIRLELFPDTKEWTESCAALRMVRNVMGPKSFGDKNIALIDVACGSTPRTAGLFAFMTRWQCTAIDPNLKIKGRYSEIERLALFPNNVQDFSLESEGTVVITAVHAHVSLPTILKSIRAKKILLVAMPCCKPLTLDKEPNIEFLDMGCWSPKRLVKVWKLGDW